MMPKARIRVPGRKRCSVCHRWKGLWHFTSHKGKIDGLSSQCRACNSVYQKGWHVKHRGSKRAYFLAKAYNMTTDDFQNMFDQQDGCDAITGVQFVGTPSIDHIAGTKIVRGLLANKTNQGLGLFDHNATWLRAAADYIDKHNGVYLPS